MPTSTLRSDERFPIVARDGWIYIGGLSLAAVLAWYWTPIFAILLGAAAGFAGWFFRDPRRTVPPDEGIILSPADGTVLSIESDVEDADVGRSTVVCIFMSVFNVHINRCPLSGSVVAVRPHRGSFLAAYREEAATANERVETVFRGPRGAVKCVQIAGLIARRIVCRLSPGNEVQAGQRYGLIKFGSRVDIYFPAGWQAAVHEGDAVRGALTVIARVPPGEP